MRKCHPTYPKPASGKDKKEQAHIDRQVPNCYAQEASPCYAASQAI